MQDQIELAQKRKQTICGFSRWNIEKRGVNYAETSGNQVDNQMEIFTFTNS